MSIDLLGVLTYTYAFYGYGVALMGLYFLLILTAYLFVYHIYLCCNNTTTWLSVKRDNIGYLRYLDALIVHPFNKGVILNLTQLFCADKLHPIVWSLPPVLLKILR